VSRVDQWVTRREIGYQSPMSTIAMQVTKRLLLPTAVLIAVLIGLGLLITRGLDQVWPFTVEDAVNRELAGDRTADLNTASLVFSAIGNTPLIIAVTAVVALVLRLTLHRWREPLFLIGAVSIQALVFLLTTLLIDRQRPDVQRLDASPPTSSFPSGHTSAAVALYCGIALILASQARATRFKVAWWSLLVLVPIGVAVARLYRGMHHPSDVTASFFNAAVCIVIMARAILDRGMAWGRDRLPSRSAKQPRMAKTAL
jgi:membrane-associated phospholipid phosphatase